MNKRRTPRFELKVPVKVTLMDASPAGKETMELLTEDIGSSGVFIRTGKPLAKDTEVDIDLILPFDRLKEMKGEKVRIKVSGLVVRADSAGIGICFDEDYEITPFGN